MTVARTLSQNGTFQSSLAFGQMAETVIAKWLLAQGRIVVPIYDIEKDTGKGPRVFGAKFEAAAPDLLVFRGDGSFMWCEAKHKTVFTWYRRDPQWETGIDLNHWEHYQNVATATGVPVYVFFLHRCSTPSASDLQHGCEPVCPTGLFGNTLDNLAKSISHKSPRHSKPGGHGRHGMVYWAEKSLRLVASLETVLEIAETASAKKTRMR